MQVKGRFSDFEERPFIVWTVERARRIGIRQIGSWRRNETPVLGSHRDAAVHLHDLARHSRRRSKLEVPAARLATLIASLVTRSG
ncbi:hypothetical protein [Dactylosporangium salmoneum]|uniref:Transposase n=1 Tax=Dactylosporangium salmoneum TaxID=53361 RepID=A0ABP5UDF6_9ACTN